MCRKGCEPILFLLLTFPLLLFEGKLNSLKEGCCWAGIEIINMLSRACDKGHSLSMEMEDNNA